MEKVEVVQFEEILYVSSERKFRQEIERIAKQFDVTLMLDFSYKYFGDKKYGTPTQTLLLELFFEQKTQCTSCKSALQSQL